MIMNRKRICQKLSAQFSKTMAEATIIAAKGSIQREPYLSINFPMTTAETPPEIILEV